MSQNTSVVDEINKTLGRLLAEPLLRPASFLRAPRGERLGKPLSEARLAVFEQVNGVKLPVEYQQFLMCVGDGGMGPGYGLCSLSTWRTVELPANLVSVELPDGTHQGLRVADHGGTDETALLLSGPETGRLVERTVGMPPRMRREPGFLEWYLTWLTEDGSSLQVGSPRGEAVLVSTLLDSLAESERARALYELGALPAVTDATVELVQRVAVQDLSSSVRYQAIELLGELELWSWKVFRAALRDSKRSVRRRALVHLLRLAGDTPAWREGLEIVRSTSDAVSAQLAGELEERRSRGTVIPQEAR
ncbi:hypothetical protein [Lentzea sp. E54]|uniref:hypothetical protein n=1 Tax=Lentzea xerophila TaxID=3435883 RepID=UPI003DA6A279